MNDKELAKLIEKGASLSVSIIATGGFFQVEVTCNKKHELIERLSGKVREWRNLDHLAKWLQGIGIDDARLSIGNWQSNHKQISKIIDSSKNGMIGGDYEQIVNTLTREGMSRNL